MTGRSVGGERRAARRRRRAAAPPSLEWATGEPPTPSVAAWDRLLSPSELQALAPADRARRVRLSLARKAHAVELAAARVAEGHPAPEVPHDRAKLRRLEDAARGFWRWGDPLLDHPDGRNGDLVARWSAAVELLRVGVLGGRGALESKIQAKDRRIGALEAQVAQLASDNRELRAAASDAAARRRR